MRVYLIVSIIMRSYGMAGKCYGGVSVYTDRANMYIVGLHGFEVRMVMGREII